MWHKNSGMCEEEILQNQFTAYLAAAVRHRRNDYIRQNTEWQQMEDISKDVIFSRESLEEEMFLGLPLFMQLESNALLYALKGISEKERHVFLARVLDGKSFESLAEELELSYKGVAAVYYRTISKIKKKMKEMGK